MTILARVSLVTSDMLLNLSETWFPLEMGKGQIRGKNKTKHTDALRTDSGTSSAFGPRKRVPHMAWVIKSTL